MKMTHCDNPHCDETQTYLGVPGTSTWLRMHVEPYGHILSQRDLDFCCWACVGHWAADQIPVK